MHSTGMNLSSLYFCIHSSHLIHSSRHRTHCQFMNKAKASAARASRFNSVLITSQASSSNRISDEVMLKDIDKSVNEWTRKCGIALTLGQVNEYLAKKNQVATNDYVVILIRVRFQLC